MFLQLLKQQPHCHFRDMVYSMTKKTIFRVHGYHVYPFSAETLVRKGGITNHHLIAYSPGNICAKNYQNRLMWIGILKPANLHHPWVACSDSSSNRKAIEKHCLCSYHVRRIFVGDSAKIAHRDVESAFNSLTVGVVEQILQNISRPP